MVKTTQSMARKRLEDVDQDKQFWYSDGRVLQNLSELAVALKEMSDETFCHHSSEAKSDFNNWVRDVIGDDKLSRDLQKSKTQAQAAKAVADRVIWLKSKAETR